MENPPERASIPVETDRSALLAEAAAIAAEAPPENSIPVVGNESAPGAPADAGPPGAIEIEPEQLARDAAPAVRGLVATLADTLAPNWEITRAESDRVGDAAALVMAYWMPQGSIEPKYLALVSLAGALYNVAGARRDATSGQWKPLRAPPKKATPETAPAQVNGGAGAVGAIRL